MTLMRFDPFRELDRLTDQTMARATRVMPMEAFRRGDVFFVAIDLPGVSSDDIDVTVEKNVVTVNATRAPIRQPDDELVIDERPQGQMSRQLMLGDNLDAGALHAGYDNGVLLLTVPVAASSKPRKVEIEGVDRQTSATVTSSEPESVSSERESVSA
jgi:HSP20 family protein